MKRLGFSVAIVTALAALIVSPMAGASDLVINGGFETGDFTGWIATGGAVLNDNVSHSGNYHADFGNGLPDVTLSQELFTTAGHSYDISFWVRTEQYSSISNHFLATFGGQTLVDESNLPDDGYLQYQYTELATGSTSLLEFSVSNGIKATLLDDVSVTEEFMPSDVPEPSTYTMCAALGLYCAGIVRSRRRYRRS